MYKLLASLLFPTKTNGYQAILAKPASLALGIAIVLGIHAVSVLTPNNDPSVLGINDDMTASQITALINLERAKLELTPLQPDPQLEAAAASKAADMLQKQYWDHFSPDHLAPWDFMDAVGYNYFSAGENLAKDYPNAASLIKAWMNSPPHRANIVSDEYSQTGIAVVQGKFQDHENSIIIVQFFATPLPAELTENENPSEDFHLTPLLTNPDSPIYYPFAHYPIWLARAMIIAVIMVASTLVIDIIWSRKLRKATPEPSPHHWQH